MSGLTFVCSLLLAAISFINAQNYILVVPKTYSPKKDINIYVQMLNPVSYETIEGKLLDNDNKTIGTGTLNLNSGNQEGTLTIKQTSAPEDGYLYNARVVVKGSGVVSFTNETSIDFFSSSRNNHPHIFIQTDKAAYKTGQKVLYRAFAVDGYLKPVNDSYKITIVDSKNIRVEERRNVSDILGVSGELQLSDHPNLGKWYIKVESEVRNPEMHKVQGAKRAISNLLYGSSVCTDDKYSLNSSWPIVSYTSTNHMTNKDMLYGQIIFEVLEYVLPKFEVQVKLPAHAITSNPELKGQVVAKYTNGKPVKGRVVLTIKKYFDWWFFDPRAIQKQFNIDGEADFVIPLDALHRFDPTLDIDTLVVEANVTESPTGISDTGSTKVQFHKDIWKIEFFGAKEDYFKPGFKYTTYLKVFHPDGRPVAGTGDRVKIGLTYYTDKPTSTRSYYLPPSIATSALMTFLSPFAGGKVIFQPDMILSVPKNGMVKLSLDIPREAATGRIDVEFKNQKLTKNLQKFRTLNGAFLNLDMKNALLKVGDKAEFILTSNVLPGSKITYHIVQDKNILLTHYTRIGSPHRPHTVYETITPNMAPSAEIVAYFVHNDGEIIADGIEFSVDPLNFQNNVELKFEKSQVEPESNITLKISADPESRVCLRVVDRSANLLKSGNDITHAEVRRKMGFHGTNEWFYQGQAIPRRLNTQMWLNIDDSSDVFNHASLAVLTDATLHKFSLSDEKSTQDISGVWERDINESLEPGFAGHGHGHDIVQSAYRQWLDPPTKVREDFPETWIWTNVTVGETGYVDMTGVVPDSITTWEATAFALNEKTGLGIAEMPSNLTVYMPFYVSIQVPFSVVNGEIALIQAVVFNYYPYDMYVTVTLMASNEDFIGTTVKYYGRQEEDDKGNMTRCILVKSNDASSAYFNIRPVRTGVVDLEVHATSPRGKDAVRRSVIVKPKGLPEEANMPVLITTQPGQQFIKEIPIEYPTNVVADSQRLRISVTGDMFGPSMDNLDALLVTPWGSGVQNMVRFAPAVYAASYLSATGKHDDELQEEIKDVLTSGYQSMVKYQMWNGGFQTFEKNFEASTWLTAFVLKSFAGASDYIYIDNEAMKNAAVYLMGQQNQDGSFKLENGDSIKHLQGLSASSFRTMTAYVLIALKEVLDREIEPSIGKNLTDSTQQASNYLNQELSQMTDDYELAITAYALTLVKSPNSRAALSKLGSSSRIVSSTDMNENWKYWKSSTKSKEIEINAYALLTYSEQQDKNSGVPIARWLVNQRNAYGGFVSTQDTVIALEALAKFAALISSNEVSMTISIETPTKKLPPFVLNADNKDMVQFIDVPGSHENVKITAVGIGTGLVEVASFYNHFGMDKESDLMQLAVTTNGSDVNQFEVEACLRSKTPTGVGLVLLDIGPPSGYTLTIPKHWRFGRYSMRVHHQEKSGDRYHFYLEKVNEEAVCVSVQALRERTIGKVQPASIRAYPYNHPDQSVTQWYLPEVLRNTTLCDVCGIECGCQFDPNKVPEERCKSGGLIPAQPLEYQGSSATWQTRTETRTANKPVVRLPPGTKWSITRSSQGGQPAIVPMGSSWSRRTRTRLGRPLIQSPAGASWRRETRIKTQPNIPVGSSWQRTTRVRAQPSIPMGSSWRRETKIRGIPTMPVGGGTTWQRSRRVFGQPVGSSTLQSRTVMRKPTGSSTWQSSQNVWTNNQGNPSNMIASRSRTINIG